MTDHQQLEQVLNNIDPESRTRLMQAAAILRGINTPETDELFRRWSNLPDDLYQLWRETPRPAVPDPVAALERIARRRGAR